MFKYSLETEDANFIEFRQGVTKTLQNRLVNIEKFKSLKNFPLIKSKQSMYIMDWKKSEITYSKGVQDMFGYTSKEFTMNAALNFIHPDDIQIVRRVIQGIINYSVNTALLSANQYLNMTFRVLKKDGTYIKVLRQSHPYQMDVEGKFISNLTFLTDISFIQSNDDKVEWEVFSDDMDVSKFKENIYKEFINFFTPREMEIMYLIQHDFTNQKIASQLLISSHTVIAHRKNILKKSNCHNTKELLVFCKLNGIT
jgi:PAS domain S-box-containing protein